jgi:hypothetical protein
MCHFWKYINRIFGTVHPSLDAEKIRQEFGLAGGFTSSLNRTGESHVSLQLGRF